MGDAARELADRGHPLCRMQLLLQCLAFAIGLAALGNVMDNQCADMSTLALVAVEGYFYCQVPAIFVQACGAIARPGPEFSPFRALQGCR